MSALRQVFDRVGLPWGRVAEIVVLGVIGALLWCATMMLVAPLYHLTAERVHPADALSQRLDETRDRVEAEGGGFIDAINVWFLERSLKFAGRLPRDLFRAVCVVFAGMLIIALLDGLVRYRHFVRVAEYAEHVQVELRQQALGRLLEGGYEGSLEGSSGDRLARSTNDLAEVNVGIRSLGMQAVREPAKIIGCFLAALFVNWRLTLFFLIGIGLVGGAVGWIGKRLKRAVRHSLEAVSTIYTSLRETFATLKVVIAYDGRDRQVEHLDERQRSLFKTVLKAERLRSLVNPLVETLSIAGVVLVVLPAAYLALRGTKEVFELTLAASTPHLVELAMLFTYLVALVDPLRKVAPLIPTIHRADAAAERVLEAIAAPPREDPGPPPPSEWSRIELAEIVYSYPSAERRALDDVGLTLCRGDVVAIVGSNGSGKSTLADVLAGLLRPGEGTIRFDGEPFGDLARSEWREHVGLVPQRAILFEGTIRENVLYGRADATDDEVREMLELVGLDRWIASLPAGIDTNVGPRGNRLSGGQRQRITIARAMIRRPNVLILDEPTSAADPASKAAFLNAMGTGREDRVTVLVTHEMPAELLRLVTRVVVLDQGRLVATGSDAELAETCTIYRTLRHAA